MAMFRRLLKNWLFTAVHCHIAPTEFSAPVKSHDRVFPNRVYLDRVFPDRVCIDRVYLHPTKHQLSVGSANISERWEVNGRTNPILQLVSSWVLIKHRSMLPYRPMKLRKDFTFLLLLTPLCEFRQCTILKCTQKVRQFMFYCCKIHM